jgi:tetratricopeptide (TPR) repeat protein
VTWNATGPPARTGFRARQLPRDVAEFIGRAQQIAAATCARKGTTGEAILRAGAASAARSGDDRTQAWLLNYLGIMLLYGGRAEEGRARLVTTTVHIRTGTDPKYEAAVTAHLAVACREFQRNDETISYSERSIVLYQAMDDPQQWRAVLNLGHFYVQTGRIEEGTSQMARAVVRLDAAGDQTAMGRVLLADGYRQLGKYHDAIQCAGTALEISRTVKDHYQEAAA